VDEEARKWTVSALESARKLEKEGYEFYIKACEKTDDEKGREMFKFLAFEEVKHYDIVNSLIKMFGGESLPMPKEEVEEKSGVFSETEGGKITEKSDELDALNIGIKAEHRSIKAYSQVYDRTDDERLKIAMKKLVDEEKRHLSILEKEVEFITDTGEWHDFRTVSM